ncbi:DUF1800 family protein [Fulvivirgaceae bacterium PWU4]|uniref:DUF1800 family protein n=1 Tax=Chryseosolibacter histidini TaxID=2782349 RepID=A0AAP2DK48_9BACT|nr:DUF1800 family protein [Chryseosolibacter histidini]MBT1697805.1 DUF1800 family protein [Chryseosolibacter histidini]
MPLPEYGGVLGQKRAAHLLRRATFGATVSQINAFAALTPAQAVTQLFRQTLPDPLPPPDPQSGNQTWCIPGPANEDREDGDLQEYVKGWIIGQMMSTGIAANLSLAYSAREKVVHFLHTHFTAIQSKIANSRAMYFQNQLFRRFALDALNPDPKINIKALSVKISVDNAMLRLLDGNLNVKGSPNENYARELLELYTIGRGLEGTLPPPTGPGDYIMFTETDVQAAAKVLSGWELDDEFETPDIDTTIPRGKVRGSITNASGHDNAPKQFSARFNNTVIQGSATLMNGSNATEASALDEIRQLIDMIYAKPETAKNICWKIYRFFAYAPHTPADSLAIDTNIITEMANTLVANNYKIQPVIENLLRSQHFYEAGAGNVKDDNFGGIIKSPIDLVLGSLRIFDLKLPDLMTATTDFYMATAEIIGTIDNLGMRFYEPYDVAGYEAYHQYPIYHRSWITPNYLARRYDFVRSLVMSSQQQGMFTVNVYNFIRANFTDAVASNARTLIITLSGYFLPVTDNLTFDDATDDTSSLTAKRLNYFKERFLQQFDEAYWTTRWNEGAIDLRDQLEFLFNAMLQSPEYQLS